MQLPVLRECENVVLKIKAIEFGLEPGEVFSFCHRASPVIPTSSFGNA